MKVLLTIFFLMISCFLFGQKVKQSSIKIQGTTSVVGGEFFINIFRNESLVKVVYKVKDSLSTKVNSDTTAEKYRKVLQSLDKYESKNGVAVNPLDNDTVKNAFERLKEIYQLYTFYSSDSIEFKIYENVGFDNLIDSVFHSSTEILEQKIKNRYILDGTRFALTLNYQNDSRTIFIHQPDENSNPLLWKLINTSLEIYRNNHKGNFLTKKQTCGY